LRATRLGRPSISKSKAGFAGPAGEPEGFLGKGGPMCAQCRSLDGESAQASLGTEAPIARIAPPLSFLDMGMGTGAEGGESIKGSASKTSADSSNGRGPEL
jgi:hypothetical protein